MIFVARYRSSDVEQSAQVPLTVQLQWEPSAQFLGFYVAKQRGFYADEKLDVRFLHGGPNVDPIANVVQKNAGIGISTADQVLRWNSTKPGEPLTAFGTVFGRSLAVFMVHANSGIKSPSDFKGKKIGVFPSYDTESLLRLLLEKENISRGDVKQVNFPSFVNFERGDIDAYGAYLINEPVLARLRKIDVRLIDPANYGVRFYSDTLIARQDYFRQHRSTVDAFVRASIRGWEASESNPNGALEDMKREVGSIFGPGEPWEHQRGVAEEAVKYLRVGRSKVFVMNRDIWQEMEVALLRLGVLAKGGIVDETCDFSLAERVNANLGGGH
jgi:NitT/TauT family transport system substrate-binding protein